MGRGFKMPLYKLIVLLSILGVAVLSDLRVRRIPNLLILFGLVVAWLAGYVAGGWSGLLDSLAGMALGMALFIPFFIPRLVGAGDVKLFGVVGGLIGLDAVLPVFLFTLVAGGVLGVIAVLLSRSWSKFFGNLKLFLIWLLYRVKGTEMSLSDVETQSAVRIPYAIAIATGSIIWLVRQS